jgi:hypothetical protein
MTRVFVDSDVILDFLLRRAPFAESAAAVFSLGERGKISLLTSTLASDSKDVEDYIQYDVAQGSHVDYLITRNTEDYPREPSFIMTPTIFLDTLPA